ncbi:hypothetical protein Bca52824_045999 [Brassica carinata]|uniref:Uncharacterized protein n=1 Tax=Brassica carinata TaxID=52824 RepID=A0A8X7UNM7_BRACI|nr:hypothetical protein Bca52824_045999 [Brassica carinata]
MPICSKREDKLCRTLDRIIYRSSRRRRTTKSKEAATLHYYRQAEPYLTQSIITNPKHHLSRDPSTQQTKPTPHRCIRGEMRACYGLSDKSQRKSMRHIGAVMQGRIREGDGTQKKRIRKRGRSQSPNLPIGSDHHLMPVLGFGTAASPPPEQLSLKQTVLDAIKRGYRIAISTDLQAI